MPVRTRTPAAGQARFAMCLRVMSRTRRFSSPSVSFEAGRTTHATKARLPTSIAEAMRLAHFVTMTEGFGLYPPMSASNLGPLGSLPSSFRTVNGYEPLKR